MRKVKRSKRHMTRGDVKMVNEEVSPRMQDEDVKNAIDCTDRFNKLRSDSGNIEYSDTLTTFFYLLMRDYLPAGKVEKLVNEVIEGAETCLFTNGFLAQYADNLASFMKEAKTKVLAKALESAFIESTPEKSADKPPKSFSIDEGDTLERLQEKVDEAVENMTAEEKQEWEEKVDVINEDIEKTEEAEKERLECDGKCKCKEGKDEGCSDCEGAEGCKETQDNEPKKCCGKCKCKEEEKDDRGEIAKAMANLDKLKKLVQTEEIEQIVKILKNEVEETLTEEAKEEVQTRESILKERVEENAEHKSSEEGSEEKALEFVKEEIEKQVKGMTSNFDEDGNLVSRGNLKDVSQGRAFPEALDKVFEEDPKVAG
jgi:hypothetical protein